MDTEAWTEAMRPQKKTTEAHQLCGLNLTNGRGSVELWNRTEGAYVLLPAHTRPLEQDVGNVEDR